MVPRLILILLLSIPVSARADDPFAAVAPYSVAVETPLIDRSGAETTLDRLIDNRPALIHVWATWCAPCREELPEIADFVASPQTADIAARLIIVSLDRSSSAHVFAFLDELGTPDLPSWHAFERTRALSTSLRLRGMPATYVVGADRTVIAFHAGPIAWSSAETIDTMRGLLGLDQ